MKPLIFVLAILLSIGLNGCGVGSQSVPEPHLELGQRINFAGGDPDKSYVIIGYRKNLEAQTDRSWKDQDYIVFLYINDLNDVKEAVIHRNAILKF